MENKASKMNNKDLNWLEIAAVVAGLSYTLLYTYGYIWCWIAAIISSLLFLYICFVKRIYAESLLHLFYVFTAIYGWMHWNDSDGGIAGNLDWSIHGMIVLSGAALVIITGALLKKMTDAATPFIDSFTTVFGVFATLLMINLIPDNWWYWIVIDAVSIYLYYKRKLYFTTALFVLYTLLALNGLVQWT